MMSHHRPKADLPDDSDENLTFVLIGETSLNQDAAFDDTTTQSFTLQSADNETCTEAPDGLLIRSPPKVNAPELW